MSHSCFSAYRRCRDDPFVHHNASPQATPFMTPKNLLVGNSPEGSGTMRYAQTMAFTTLVFFSLFTVFNARSDERSASIGMFSNKWLLGAVLLSLLLQVAVIYTPFLQQAFSTVSLSGDDWLRCAAVASSVLWLRELSKLVWRFVHPDR